MSGSEILKVQLLSVLDGIGVLCADVNNMIAQYSGPIVTASGQLSAITEKSAYCLDVTISYGMRKPYGENGISLNALIWDCDVEIKIDFVTLHDRQSILIKLLNGLPSNFNRPPILVRQIYRAIDKMIDDFYWRRLSQSQLMATHLLEQYWDRIELNRTLRDIQLTPPLGNYWGQIELNRTLHNIQLISLLKRPYNFDWSYLPQI